jgi:hydroxymethylglutaryl-CoA lyase
MQGVIPFIPTAKKIDYINSLIAVGYEVIDIGSFVSAKAIPQLRDSHDVINGVSWEKNKPDFPFLKPFNCAILPLHKRIV